EKDTDKTDPMWPVSVRTGTWAWTPIGRAGSNNAVKIACTVIRQFIAMSQLLRILFEGTQRPGCLSASRSRATSVPEPGNAPPPGHVDAPHMYRPGIGI